MTPTPHDSSDVPQGVPPWEQMLRSMFGDDADKVIGEMRAQGFDPEQLVGSGGLPEDPVMLSAALDQMNRLLNADDGSPVNSTVAHDMARQVAMSDGADPSTTLASKREVAEAFTLAELWLDAATEFPPSGGSSVAWSRAEWVEATLPTWINLTAPVARAVVEALVTLLRSEFDDHTGNDPFAFDSMTDNESNSDMTHDALLRRVGSAVFGMQVGQATGTMAQEVFGTTDVGVPLVSGSGTALVIHNVNQFAADLDIPIGDVRRFIAMREAASARLFTHVPWLRSHLTGLVEAYASGVEIDLEALEGTVRDIDPMNASELQKALSSGLFAVSSTPDQQATLLRLETVLALIEGWVDAVVAEAAGPHIPSVVGLREMIRRRRAAGGPAERTFADLVGLELRPRRAREATRLWELLRIRSGTTGRDQVWDHPDFMPTGADLDDPEGFVNRRLSGSADTADVDAALEELLRGDGPATPDSTTD